MLDEFDYLFLAYIGLIKKHFDVYPLNNDINLNKPIVLKYDGLANGKGVMVCETTNDIVCFLKRVYVNKEFDA